VVEVEGRDGWKEEAAEEVVGREAILRKREIMIDQAGDRVDVLVDRAVVVEEDPDGAAAVTVVVPRKWVKELVAEEVVAEQPH
jgi:hypothetical protein